MAIQLQATRISDVIFMVSALSGTTDHISDSCNIVWNTYTVSEYVTAVNNTVANGNIWPSYATNLYFDAPSAVSTGVDVLELTATSNLTPFWLVASADQDQEPSTYYFEPYHIKVVPLTQTINTVLLSAYYFNLDETYFESITGKSIKWDIDNTTDLVAVVNGDSWDYVWGSLSASEVGGIDLVSTATEPETAYSLIFTVDGALSSTASFDFIINPGIQYDVILIETNAIELNAVLKNGTGLFSTDTLIKWGISPSSTALSALISPSGISYDFSDQYVGGISYGLPGYGFDLSGIRVTTTDLTGSYSITLSSNWGTYTSNSLFKPFLYLTDASLLISALQLTDTIAPTRYYNFTIYGETNGVIHNLSPDQQIKYQNISTSSGLIAYNTAYTNQYNWTPTEGYNVVGVVDPLRLEVTTPVVTGSVQTQVYTISALVNDVPNIEILDLVTQFGVDQWAADSIFSVNFRINNEPISTTDMYRLTGTRDVTLYNNICIPDGSTGTLLFDLDGVQGTLPLTFTSTICSFTSLTPTICTIGLTAYNVLAPNWTQPQTKVAPVKRYHFYSFMPSADFIIFPSWSYSPGTTSYQVVSADPWNLSPGPSAYGFCHTEYFHISAFDYSGLSYSWFIDSQFIGLDQSILTDYPIRSTSDTETYRIELQISSGELPLGMPYFYYSDSTGAQIPYGNYTNTSLNLSIVNAIGSPMKTDILMKSFNDYIDSNIAILYNPLGVSSNSLRLRGIGDFPDYLPVSLGHTSVFTWNISTGYWEVEYDDSIATRVIPIGVNGLGTVENILKYDSSLIQIQLDLQTTVVSKDLTGVRDWCSNMATFSSIVEVVTAYPLIPFIYTPNKYVLTGEEVSFENLVPYFSEISGFRWSDRGNTIAYTTPVMYLTSYTTADQYSITLTTVHSSQDLSVYQEGRTYDIITVYDNFTTYNTDINRVFGVTKLQLPNNIQRCEMPPNEWAIYTNINKVFDKLDDNLTYLKDMSKVYDNPPTEFYGWYGTFALSDGKPRTHWNVNQEGLNDLYLSPVSGINGPFYNLRDCVVRDVSGIGNNVMFVSDSTTVYILSSDFRGTIIDSISYKGVGDDFADVVAIGVDLDDRIYILDAPKNRVIVYSYTFSKNRWNLLYDWGGLGGTGAHSKFRNPTDLLVGSNNTIWITDSDNCCVKKFSRTGGWIQTITSSYFSQTNKPLSTALDTDGNIYVLAQQHQIIKFDSTGQFIKVITIQISDSVLVRKLEHCVDGGYLYICAKDRIVKIAYDGTVVGTFAAGEEYTFNSNYTNVFHDQNRNLYITSNNVILKYIDKLTLLDLCVNTDNYVWLMSSIYIKKDEYNQDWVLNRSFARMWDNIEIFRRSLLGKFDYSTVDDSPIIRTFTPNEYQYLPYQKNDIYVGINELVMSDVVNNAIDKLYECEYTLLQMISG